MRFLPAIALLVLIAALPPAALAQLPIPGLPGLPGQAPATPGQAPAIPGQGPSTPSPTPPAPGQAPASPSPTPAPTYRPSTPSAKTLYEDGNEGRFLVDGAWLFRKDPKDQGVRRKYFRQTSTRGWSAVAVPHDWTARDLSIPSMNGGVGWYRKDFRLPDKRSGLAWLARFESVNYRAAVYLNGRKVGEHTGANLPFEVALKGLKRGVNRLVVRVDSRRSSSDLPPGGNGSDGRPRGGWWNASGLLREVYLRRVDQVDFERVRVTPTLKSLGGPARVEVETTLRNRSSKRQAVRVRGRFGSVAIKLGSTTIAAGDDRVLKRTITVPSPRLWSPDKPNLYDVTLDGTARAAGGGGGRGSRRARAIEGYELRSGIRRIDITPDGRLALNGRVLNLRGFGLHEDNVNTGAAVTNEIRDLYINSVKELGGTLIRGHYPFSPYLQEQADRKGILMYSEIPVWSVESIFLQRASVKAAALDQLRENIFANGNHPSVLTWSIGNELTSRPGPPEQAWIGTATRTAKKLDPTRPVTMALIGYPPSECRTVYRPLDFISVNTYFGWYPGPVGQTADYQQLSAFLDTIRGCFPSKPVMVTEFGAEGNRSGPPEEKGTFEFQANYLNDTLAVFAGKPYLAGAVYWTLQEFRVRPGYMGGNPRGEAPWHQKGPLDRNGARKPVFGQLQQAYTQTQQLGAPAAPVPAAPAPRARR
ncbi:beta-glucuronidase [soil metagenome]